MRVPPYFTYDNRFLILQLGKNLYIVDVILWKLQFQVKAFPIGISKDETLLLVGNTNPVGATLSSVYEIESGKEFPLKAIKSTAFEMSQRLYYSQFIEGQRLQGSRIQPKQVVFRDSFYYSITQEIEIGKEKASSEWMHQNRPVSRTLGESIVVFSGWWDSDWGGYDFVWIANLDSSRFIYTSNIMSEAPIRINYTAQSQKLMLIPGDGVQMVDVTKYTETGKANIVLNSKPFNTHTVWRGNPEIIDAVAHPFDANRVIIAEQNKWYEMHEESLVDWSRQESHSVEKEILRITYYSDPNILLVATVDDIRLYEIQTGKLIQTLVI